MWDLEEYGVHPDSPMLGDAMLTARSPVGPASSGTATSAAVVWDPRVDDLLRRIEALEQQTPAAYWHRFVTWLQALWGRLHV